MSHKRFISLFSLAFALSAVAVAPAFAETPADMSFDGMTAMAMMDKNKDGMVSKAEFLEVMGKVWDEQAKKSGVKDTRMAAEQYRQVLLYMRSGK